MSSCGVGPARIRAVPFFPSFFRCIALCLLLLPLVAPAQAQSVPVRLDAPEPLGELLKKHLDFLGQRDPASLDDGGQIALMRRARKEIREILATEGYFSPAINRGRDEDGNLTIQVVPGARTTITAVELSFSGEISHEGEGRPDRLAALRARWGLPVGQPFRQADWDGAKQQLLDALATREHAAARIVESQVLVDAEKATAALRVHLDSGPVFRFGVLQVSGLSDHDESLVRRYRPPEPGTLYSLERLLRFQTTLQNTPYFASVVAEIDPQTASPEAVPVRVQVVEAQPKRVGFGVGISSNTGYRVETSYRNTNFHGHAWNLNSGVRLEQRRQLGYADIFLPPATNGNLDSIGVLAEQTDISGLKTQRQAIGVVRTMPSGNIENRLAFNYQHEILTPDGSQRSSRDALTANWSWTHRAVDDILDPHEGHVLNLQLGGASRALLSDRNFVRIYGRYQHFIPVRSRDVLILRAEGGMTVAESREGVPQDFLFRTGGSQTVRGYGYQSLGVRDGTATVGGRYLAVTSLEYVHWYKGDWGLAAFVDAGNANDERKLFKMQLGYGLGPRWRSPAGPIALDLAYGQSDHRLRLQFAIAIAF